MGFKFVHAADIHLDSPMRGLDRYEGAPTESLRGATRRAFAGLVDWCREEQVAFLLLAGDLFDGNWRDYNSGLFFVSQMARLREASIPVLMVRGNHDAESRITSSLRLPENVHDFDTKKATTRSLEALDVAVHGHGYKTQSVTEDLSIGYPSPVPGALNLGLLHTSADGREGHLPYAPCSVPRLVDKGYDYWALGHVHNREVLHASPPIVFPGNLQGRRSNEAGAKGATVVSVEDRRVVSIEHRSFDVVRWSVCDVDPSDAATGHDVVDLARAALAHAVEAAEGRALAARVRIRGRTRAHAHLTADPDKWENEVRAAATDLAAEGIWVEKVLLQTSSHLDFGALRRRDDPVGALLRTIEEIRADDAGKVLAPLLSELEALRLRLPPELREGGDAAPLHLEGLRATMLEVEQILVPRILTAGGVEGDA